METNQIQYKRTILFSIYHNVSICQIVLPVLSEFRTINWKAIQQELQFSQILLLLKKETIA